ncbi:hypothetical protein BH10PSE7_BH10PSE7_34490 [soil metagenome]
MASDLIFIVGRQRSGTSVFRAHLLKNGAFDAGEIFHDSLTMDHAFYRYVAERVKTDPALMHPASHPQMFREYIGHLRGLAQGSPIAMDVKYFGLHLIPFWGSQVGRGKFFVIKFMKDSGAHLIHIARRNKLRVHVSEAIAAATGEWFKDRPDAGAKDPKIEIDCATLVGRIRDLCGQEQAVRQQLKSIDGHRELFYEEMFLADGRFAPETVAAMESALGKKGLGDEPPHYRMNPQSLPDIVSNFERVADTLAPTPYAWMTAG